MSEPTKPLDSAEVSVKLFVEDPAGVRMLELIPVFHRWIKQDLLQDELMIDVANYEHVPKGPGIVLICDKAHYYFEVRAGRMGLRYRGRRDARARGADAVTHAFRSALQAARLLETDPALEGRYTFRTDEVELGIYDRLLAPSEAATLEAIRAPLGEAVRSLYGSDDVGLELASNPREPFMVTVKTGASPSVEELLGRLTAAGAA
jgi:hypothetical protein